MKITDLPLRPEMARARADGRKTMTRRLVKPQPEEVGFGRNCIVKPYCTGTEWPLAYYEWRGACWNSSPALKCPYGQPGDRIRWLTTWAVHWSFDDKRPLELPPLKNGSDFWSYHDTAFEPDGFGKLRPGRFLPLFLRDRMPVDEIVGIRVERVLDITEEDAEKEGVAAYDVIAHPDNPVQAQSAYRTGFRMLWNRIHGPGAWKRNDWVWVIEFRRIGGEQK